ncbi:MAG: exonuclease subunit SbcD [Bacteroidales bacterium]|nr:exonuclease subunit SbcD [Bacteroidales bacterium]
MKILHTGDWHLGHTLYNYDRSEEQAGFLSQIRDIVAENQPDAMIVAGDIYHYASPSTAAQTLYCEHMLGIHQACPDMQIIVIADNHDSASKLMVDSTLWKHFNLITLGTIHPAQYDDYIIPVVRQNTTIGYVAAFPFAYPRFLPDNFFAGVLDRLHQKNDRHLPVVAAAHLAVMNSDYSCHNNIGTLDCVNADIFGTNYDYLALGHIHRAQTLSHSPTIRYSGTPIGINFDEDIQKKPSETYLHSVSMIECINNNTTVYAKEITSLRPLITLPSQATDFETAVQALRNFPEDRQAYIRLNVLVKDFLPYNANMLANEACRDKACRFCYIHTSRQEQESAAGNSGHMTIETFQQENYLDIAKQHYRNVYQAPLPRYMEDALIEAYTDLTKENAEL